jgi:curved DNA-binding protein
VNDTPDAEARFKAVNDAYDILKNPEKRAAYDQYGTTDPQYQQARQESARDWRGGFEFSRRGGAQGDPFADIFEAFGRGHGGGFADGGGAFAADQHVRLQISLEDAFRGATREVRLQQPRINAAGEVVLEDHRVAIPIPAGVLPGQFLRLPGRGLKAREGAPPGDLIVEISFAPHPTYRVDGRDLYLELPVTPWEAALGANLVLPTPSGEVSLKVPKNSSSGQKLRLKGRGLPTHPPGHIYVTLKIVNPDASSDEARAFFEKMAKTFTFDPRKSMKG